MTVDEAARMLKEMYAVGATKGRGRATTGIHLFGIKYADELSGLSVKEIVLKAGISDKYVTEVNKGRRLAEYVKVIKDLG